MIRNVKEIVERLNNILEKRLRPDELENSVRTLEHKRDFDERIKTLLIDILDKRKDIKNLRNGLESMLIERNAELKDANERLEREVAFRKSVEEELRISNEQQRILNSIVKISMENIPLERQYELILDSVLSIPWLPPFPMGAIMLTGDDPEFLALTAYRNFPESVIKRCSIVPFGTCMCGLAASTGVIQFSSEQDDRHLFHDDNVEDHGHYCIPITLGSKVLGVLALHLTRGHTVKSYEVDFLLSVVNTLAGIIERKRVEKELRVLSRAVEQSPTSVIITNTAGNIEYVNPRFTTLTGFASEEVIGETPHFLKSVWMTEEEHNEIWSALSEGNEWHGEFQNKKKSGELYWEFVSISPIRNTEGEIIHYLLINEDITERKQAAEELKEVALFAEMNPAPVVRLSRNGTIMLINKATSVIFGNKDLVGRSWFEVCPGIKKSRFRRLLDQSGTLQHESQIGNENFLFTYKGNPDSDFVYVYGAEITVRKLIEAELKRARDIAVESARHKSEFLANMSHEIRTPMNGVLGMTELLGNTQLTSEQREYVETIASSGNLLLSIINDILDLSKIEAGKLQLASIIFDLRTVVEDVIELHAASAYSKGLDFNCFIPNDIPTMVKGDPTRLQQVISNLLNNAIKFTINGTVTVFVELLSEMDDTITFRFKVTDTGVGISQDDKLKLFRYFSQLDASTTRKFGGTGLGLAISKQLVELMGGEIGVDSELGAGSKFWFSASFQRQADTADTFKIEYQLLKRLKVLVIDDAQTGVNALKRMLDRWNVNYSEARECRHGLDMLYQSDNGTDPFNVIIVDMMINCVAVEGFLNTIAAMPFSFNLRIVLLTPPGRRIDISNNYFKRKVYYIHKPVRQSRIYNCLSDIARDKEEIPPPLNLPLSGRPVTTSSKMKKVLVVEDDPVNQKVTARMLDILNYSYDIAANGLEAIDALTRNRYDLALMDCQMPEMDGFEVTRRYRRIEKEAGQNRHIPIIALTANVMQGDQERCFKVGMDDYLAKPLKQSDLHAMLKRWLFDKSGVGLGQEEAADTLARDDLYPVIDIHIFNNLQSLMGSGIDGLITVFLTDAQLLIDNIGESIETSDIERLRMTSHRLKSSCSNMGAMGLSHISKSLEDLAVSGTADDAGGLLLSLKDEFLRTRQELSNMLVAR